MSCISFKLKNIYYSRHQNLDIYVNFFPYVKIFINYRSVMIKNTVVSNISLFSDKSLTIIITTNFLMQLNLHCYI